MTKQEEAKILLPFMQATAEGKTVQERSPGDTIHGDWADMEDAHFTLKDSMGRRWEYRMKPEPKYRPFTAEEMLSQSSRVIYHRDNPNLYFGVTVDKCCAFLFDDGKCVEHVPYRYLLRDYKFFDNGDPCGVLEEASGS